MSGYYFALAACVALVVFLVVLLRRRRLREKYATAWILLALGVCVLGAFPGAVEAVASVVGVRTPSNLLFALALVVLLGVCIQLSVEITMLEEESRTLTEEISLLRYDVEELAARVGSSPAASPASAPALPSAVQDPVPDAGLGGALVDVVRAPADVRDDG
ncbi:DUF2304 domain-containing protein [Sanguibacter suaedae]|uniref:DUF2304 domain-containing protein n=1 Tax=Sanguibacter suaedae TaxID=2795737 RepID=A0A934I3X9_9MICO|nr:DUF2304 domain-containing protein [Sanguibacter suaedae]MBI9114783.1 DUF2304 domain-containing protein [Sanguibacter suaedae]